MPEIHSHRMDRPRDTVLLRFYYSLDTHGNECLLTLNRDGEPYLRNDLLDHQFDPIPKFLPTISRFQAGP